MTDAHEDPEAPGVEKRQGQIWFEMTWLLEQLFQVLPDQDAALAWHKILGNAAEELGNEDAAKWIRKRVDDVQN